MNTVCICDINPCLLLTFPRERENFSDHHSSYGKMEEFFSS